MYTQEELFCDLKIDKAECSKCDKKKNCSCLSVQDVKMPIEEAKKRFGCQSELCVAKKLGLSTDIFKPEGPREGTGLLSNVRIEQVFAKWANEFRDFYAYPFCLADFDKNGGSLSKTNITDLIKSGKTRAACIINTATTTDILPDGSGGKHWICIFADASAPEVRLEFFNSSGRPPIQSVAGFLLLAKANIEAQLGRKVHIEFGTGLIHQKGHSECGVYCLYFIRKRLEGANYGFFGRKRIADEDITEFRKFIFTENK